MIAVASTRTPRPRSAWLAVVGLVLAIGVLQAQAPQSAPSPQPRDPQSTEPAPRVQGRGDEFRFRSGVELINITATVYDAEGHFVPGLTQDDFTVFEDGRPQEITNFTAERVPVSLGIVLDTSGSMEGDKIRSAQSALNRFLNELLDEDDEVFLYRFSDTPLLLHGWTNDRAVVSRAIGRIAPNGGTALYDAVAEAIPLAQSGSRRKKALLIISDGNDTSSETSLRDLRAQIRQSEVLVYAIGIDGDGQPPTYRRQPFPPRRGPGSGYPPTFPPTRGRGGRGGRFPQLVSPIGAVSPGAAGAAAQFGIGIPNQGRFPPSGGSGGGSGGATGGRPQPGFPGNYQGDDRVNAAALRELTDESGGRTEIIHDSHDLDPATEGIADELSRQYFLGYPAGGGVGGDGVAGGRTKDGRYHTIRVETRDRTYRVRARRGYQAN